MNIYNKLNIDIQDKIDIQYFKKYVKPLQDKVIEEIGIFFEPKCIQCNKPLKYINYYGDIEYYIRIHELCILCDNWDDWNNESSSDFHFDYETSPSSMSSVSNESANTI